MRYSNNIYDVQKERSLIFPPDRIAFLKNFDYVARMDKATFEAYRKKQITITEACRQIASNNNLPEVSQEAFLNEFRMLGYAYYGKD